MLDGIAGSGEYSATKPNGAFMNKDFKQTVSVAALVLGGFSSLCHAQSPLPDDFNPPLVPDYRRPGPYPPTTYDKAWVYSAVEQTDGKIILGGEFLGAVGGLTGGLVRLHPDGTPDLSFNPKVTNDVYAVALPVDGKILFAGDFQRVGTFMCKGLARLDGGDVVELTFNPQATNSFYPSLTQEVFALMPQTNGMILVAGAFDRLNGQIRNGIGRLNDDGSVDAGFNPVPNNRLTSMAIQADGRILIAGIFTTVSGVPRNRIARLNANGTVDPDFHPDGGNVVFAMLEQPDGKILVGGELTSFAGVARTNLARINADGSIDESFDAGQIGRVYSMALQADGKLIVGGRAVVGGGLARLNSDGSTDSSFNPPIFNDWVLSVSIQSDGKIIAGGKFTRVGALSRTNIVRFYATEPATQNLDYTNGTITWLRGGTSPEAWRTTFEYTADALTWTNLGTGTRIPGGWTLTNLALPSGGVIRARGHVIGGQFNGSCWFVETLLRVGPQTAPTILTDDGNLGVISDQFGFNVHGDTNQIVVVESSTNLLDWLPLQTNIVTGDTFYVSDPEWSQAVQRFYRARLWP